jgi:predicted Zn finger-like uncharacterized protein
LEVAVIISCPRCQAQYRYDVARFGDLQRKRVKCPKCATIFEVANPSPDAEEATRIGGVILESPPVAETVEAARAEAEMPELPELAPLPADLRFSLAVIAGSQAGSVFPITKPRVYLGRGSSMDLQLKDAEVSRRHAMLEIRGEEATLVDLGATNGTFVGGQRVGRADIGNQSEFTLGSTTLMLIVTPSGNGGL